MPSFFDSAINVAITSFELALPRTISSKPHHIRRTEKMRADHPFRPRYVAEAISSIFKVEVLVARIAPGLITLSNSREDLFLKRHAFKDRFHHHVHFAEAFVSERGHGCDAIRLSISSCEKRPFFDGIRVVLANRRQATVERLLIGLLQQHRDSGIRKNHRDAAAHGSRSHHGRLVHRNQCACPSACREFSPTSRSPKKTWIRALD